MKIKNLLFILLITFPFLSYGQEYVENITWEFSDLKMIVTYDLISPDGKNRNYDISMEIVMGDEIIRPSTGIIGINQQQNGKGKKIEWYFTRSGKTEMEINVEGLQVIVNATNPNPPIEINSKPIVTEKSSTSVIKKTQGPSLLLPTITTAAGAGVLIAGIIQEGKAKDLYDIYKAHVFDTGQRELDYQRANDKHKNAQFLAISGGAILGVSAFWLFSNMKKRKNNNGFTVVPALEDAPLYGVYSGVGVRYSF